MEVNSSRRISAKFWNIRVPNTSTAARELLDAIDACMKTGERQTTDSVDVWRTADDLPLFGMHVGIDGASWTCGAVRSWDVDGLADELEALLLD